MVGNYNLAASVCVILSQASDIGEMVQTKPFLFSSPEHE